MIEYFWNITMTITGDVLLRVGKTLRRADDYDEKKYLTGILTKDKEYGIRVIGLDNGKKYDAQLFEKDQSLSRLTYMLDKWYAQQFKGGGLVEYLLFEDIKKREDFHEKITHIH